MRRSRIYLTLLVVGLLMIPLSAAAHHISEGDLRRAFYSGDADLQFSLHSRILPFTNEGDPNLRCVGDAAGTWANVGGSWGPDGDYETRADLVEFLDSVHQTYELDVNGDGDPIPLDVVRTPPTGPPDRTRMAEGVPVIDNDLLPEGRHVLHWTATGGGFDQEVDVPIWIADCERTGNIVAKADDVVVEVSTIDVSGYFNLIYLDQPYDQFIGVDGFGDVVTLEGVGEGTELVFRIEIWECAEGDTWGDPSCGDTSDVWYSDPSLNADGLKQSLHIQDGDQTWMFFNDNGYDPAGSDEPFEPNFIDAIFTVNPSHA